MTGSIEPHRPGDIIGNRYEVRSVLGKGGFGVVYRVTARHDGRDYALKTTLHGSTDRRLIQRFEMEAQIWIALGKHAHIVQAHFVDEVEGRLYVGMELIAPGPNGLNSLDGYVRHERPDLKQTLAWGIQICHGMEYALSRGVRSHRDLKPANVMIAADRTVRISDFGLAAHAGTVAHESGETGSETTASEGFHGQTIRGQGFGTPTHMPPEQFDDAGGADERSDIYAVGILFFELITGRLPVVFPSVDGHGLEARMRQWSAFREAHQSFVLPRLGHPMDSVLARCIVSEPSGRYSTFASLRTDLEALLWERFGLKIEAPGTRVDTAADWCNRGTSLERLGRSDDALQAFDRALALDPHSVPALLGAGICHSRRRRYAQALQSFEVVLTLEPGHAGAWSNMGNCLQALGRTDEALAAFDCALRHDPSMATTWSNRGNLLYRRGRLTDALESYNRSLVLEPERRAIRSNRGYALAALGETEQALTVFESVTADDRRFAPALRGLAACRMRTGRWQASAEAYERLETLGRLRASDWLGRGIAHLHLDRQGDAIRAMTFAAEDPAWRGRARLGLAILQFRTRRYEAACTLAGDAVAGDALTGPTDDAVARALLGLFLHADGRFDEAIDLGRTLHEADEFDVTIACNLASSLLRADRPAEAVAILDQTMEANGRPIGSTSVLHYDRAVARLAAGRLRDAESDLDEVIRLEPCWADPWRCLGIVQWRLGLTAAALDAFRVSTRFELEHAAWWRSSLKKTTLDATRVPDRFHPAQVGSTLRNQHASATGPDMTWAAQMMLLEPRYLPTVLTQ